MRCSLITHENYRKLTKPHNRWCLKNILIKISGIVYRWKGNIILIIFHNRKISLKMRCSLITHENYRKLTKPHNRWCVKNILIKISGIVYRWKGNIILIIFHNRKSLKMRCWLIIHEIYRQFTKPHRWCVKKILIKISVIV